MAGLELDPWQRMLLRESLGERRDGRWAAFEVAVVVGRQNGKTVLLEARELAELFLVARQAGPRLVIHSAHQFKTALEHFRRVKQRILDTPVLRERVKGPVRRGMPAGIRDSHGEESIELVDGSRLIIAARTSTGGQGRGFTGDLLVWDEAMNLPDSVVGAVLPTLSAKTLDVPGAQVWYASSAVNQATMPYGVQLARLRERGIAGDDPELLYAEWSVDERELAANPQMADDPVVWAQANPALGDRPPARIAVDHVRRERRGAMPWNEFLVERLGVGDWPSTSDDSERLITAEAWMTLADPASRITGLPVFAVDVDPDQAWATVAAAGRRDDGVAHIGVVDHRRGTEWIVDRCRQLAADHPGSRFVVDGRATASMLIPDLEDSGLVVVRISAGEYAVACGSFLRAVMERQIRFMPPQPELDAAVAAARTKPLLERELWKWSRRHSAACITPLVAATLALWGLGVQRAPEVWDLNEIAERIRGDTPPAAPRPEPRPASVHPNWVPLSQAPIRR